MKTNRMFEIIMILLNEGEVKAKDLAERFNCTTKTIYRDVEYIKDSGIPIISELGRNGGFKLGTGFSKNNKNLSLKEQHTIIKALKDHGRLPEEQLDEIMTTIEGLFKDDSIDWIDVDLGDPKVNDYFNNLKSAIINCNLVDMYIKAYDDEISKIRIEPYQIIIGYNDLYLRFLNSKNGKWDEASLKEISGIDLLGEGFVKKDLPKSWNRI